MTSGADAPEPQDLGSNKGVVKAVAKPACSSTSFPRKCIGANLMICLVLISSYKTDEVFERHSREGGDPACSMTSGPRLRGGDGS
jgi:hypothetical protein